MVAQSVRFEFQRQAFHLVFGSFLALIVLGFRSSAWIVFMALFFVGLVISEAVRRGVYVPLFSECLRVFERGEARPGRGALLFVLGGFLASFFFPPAAAFTSMLVLANVDSFSTLVGKACGRTRLPGGKSAEGMLAGFAAGFGVCLFYLPFLYAFAVAAVAALVEAFSPIDDNLAVPLAASAVIYILKAA